MKYLTLNKFYVLDTENEDNITLNLLKILGFRVELRMYIDNIRYYDIYYDDVMVCPDDIIDITKHKLSQTHQLAL